MQTKQTMCSTLLRLQIAACERHFHRQTVRFERRCLPDGSRLHIARNINNNSHQSLSLSLTFIHSQIRLLSCTHVKIASTSTITTATLNKLRISLNLNTVCMFQSIDVALWPLNLHIFHSNTLSQLTFHTQIICFGIPDQNCNLI